MYTMAAAAECDGHYYVFRYDQEHVPHVLKAIRDVAFDPESKLSVEDGRALGNRVIDAIDG